MSRKSLQSHSLKYVHAIEDIAFCRKIKQSTCNECAPEWMTRDRANIHSFAIYCVKWCAFYLEKKLIEIAEKLRNCSSSQLVREQWVSFEFIFIENLCVHVWMCISVIRQRILHCLKYQNRFIFFVFFFISSMNYKNDTNQKFFTAFILVVLCLFLLQFSLGAFQVEQFIFGIAIKSQNNFITQTHTKDHIWCRLDQPYTTIST